MCCECWVEFKGNVYNDIPKDNTSLSYNNSNFSIPNLSQTDERNGIIAPPSPQHSSNITCNILKTLDVSTY